MASFFPQIFRDIDVIRLNNITIFNANNTLPSSGTVLTVSSGRAYMLPVTANAGQSTTVGQISESLSSAWSNLSSLSSYVRYMSTGGGDVTSAQFQGLSTFVLGQSTTIGQISDSLSSAWISLSSLSSTGASLWANYAAISSVNVAGNNILNASNITILNTITLGSSNIISGSNNIATGASNTISSANSYIEGVGNRLFGLVSHIEGQQNFISTTADYSHAEGFSSIVLATYSHSEGASNIVSGAFSHAEGRANSNAGFACHVEGRESIITAAAFYSHAEGFSTLVTESQCHAEGWGSRATGNTSHAEGHLTIASAFCSHAEGFSNVASASNSHAEGWRTTASGIASHAEGISTIASGIASHAEGISTIASGLYTHAGGQRTAATSTASYAFGISNVASNYGSAIVQGFSNQTAASYQTVMGQFCRPREDNAVAYASGAFLNSTATAFVPGSAQSFMFNMHGTTSTSLSVYYPLVNFTNSGTGVVSTNQIFINAESNAFFMHTVDMTLTGYERKLNTGLGTGLGAVFAKYTFQVLWDISTRQTLYAYVGSNSSVPAISNGNSNISIPSYLRNGYLSGGNYPDVSLFISSVGAATSNRTGYYTLSVKSNNGVCPMNWVAQLNVTEVMQNLWAPP